MRMWLALAAVLFEIAASQSFLVVAEGFSAFRIGPLGSTGSTNPTNPTLTVAVGDNLTFLAQTASFHPFSIHTSPGSVGSAARYRSPDISGANPASLNATLVWTISASTPTPLFYQCENHMAMTGRIDIVGGIVNTTVATTGTAGYLTAHAVLMSLSFCLLIPLGVMTSSFLPHQLVISWLPIHVALQVAATCCVIAGFGVILYFVSANGGGHFQNATSTSTQHTHSILGIIVLSLVVLQVGLGVFSDAWWRFRFWRNGTIPLPGPPEKTHWWLGRFLVVASIVQVFLGLVEGQAIVGYGDWVYGLYAAWYGIVAIVFVVAIVKLRLALMAKKRTEDKARGRVKKSDSGLSSKQQTESVRAEDTMTGLVEL